MKKPVIYILSMGGTIAMTKEAESTKGVVPKLTGAALAAAVPGLSELADIKTKQICQVGSSQLQFSDIEAVAQEINTIHNDNSATGVIITQGTDTIEETAFILDQLVDVPFPVVVTGAMRNPTLPGAEGSANILAATLVASNANSSGVLVVLNDEIHAASFVHKAHTSLTNAFASPVSGRLGWVSENQVFLVATPTIQSKVKISSSPKDVTVPIIKTGLGDKGELIAELNKSQVNFDGLVIEGTGGGHVSEEYAIELGKLAQRFPIVFASRTGNGATLTKTYGYKGSELDLLNKGLISSGWLDGCKSRILLSLLLRHQTNQRSEIIEAFKVRGGTGY